MTTATRERPAKAKAAKGATAVAGAPKAMTPAAGRATNRISDKVRGIVLGGLDLASNEVRFRALEILNDGECNVSDMSAEIGITQPAISHHLTFLRHAKLVEFRRDGKSNVYSLTDAGRTLWAGCSSYAAAVDSSG